MSQRTDAGEPRNAMMITGGIVLVSFRPILRLPRMVSFAGAAGCLLAMFVVNPTFGLAALAIVVVFYGLLVRRTLDHSMADVHRGPVHRGSVHQRRALTLLCSRQLLRVARALLCAIGLWVVAVGCSASSRVADPTPFSTSGTSGSLPSRCKTLTERFWWTQTNGSVVSWRTHWPPLNFLEPSTL